MCSMHLLLTRELVTGPPCMLIKYTAAIVVKVFEIQGLMLVTPLLNLCSEMG